MTGFMCLPVSGVLHDVGPNLTDSPCEPLREGGVGEVQGLGGARGKVHQLGQRLSADLDSLDVVACHTHNIARPSLSTQPPDQRYVPPW